MNDGKIYLLVLNIGVIGDFEHIFSSMMVIET